ncbi:carbohydrate sulfotransferase 13-like [Mizuhopecten yessoensis]|uniref:carbohydrate sulfotransferase 13-like n=1 Tax=Mizuhopecten yessoensis TaxID=6573 RepID=UPI000B457866|nr:carbohydrate sulfotransferase 13-like [Mizuhopecten yessoensis]
MEAIYQERRNRMLKACVGREAEMKGKNTAKYVKNNIIIDQVLGIAYCPVEKIASTFWKRVLRLVVGEAHAKSPFDSTVIALANFNDMTSIPEGMVDRFMKESLTFMFVREPYGRLLSAYVDKLFSPNLYYWKIYGGFGVHVTRNESTECGHNLTFKEFVKTVLYADEVNQKRDGHFTPSYEHCDPCRYKWHVIGTLDTLSQDIFYILDRIGRTDLMRSLNKDFREQYLNHTILDQFNWLFFFRDSYANDCNVTFYEAQKRLWKQFQIRGVLTKESEFPLTTEESEGLTKTKLMSIVYNAMGNAEKRSKARKNKAEAIKEAYSTLDRDDLDKLSKMFQPDCDLYGYDCKPEQLFNTERTVIEPWFFKYDT